MTRDGRRRPDELAAEAPGPEDVAVRRRDEQAAQCRRMQTVAATDAGRRCAQELKGVKGKSYLALD